MRVKFLPTAAILLALCYPAIGAAQTPTQGQQQQMQASGQQKLQNIQQKLQQAEQALQQRDTQGAQQALDQAGKSIELAVQQAEGQQQKNLGQIQERIRQAQQALRQQDEQGATQALAQARQSSEQQMAEQRTAAADTAAIPADGSETNTAVQQESLDRARQEQATTEPEQTKADQQQATVGGELQQPLETEEIIGRTALTPEGEDLGEIGDLVMSEEGDIEAAIIDVGGFLGIGERQVAVDWSKVAMSTENDQIVINMTREELESAPDYEASGQAGEAVQ